MIVLLVNVIRYAHIIQNREINKFTLTSILNHCSECRSNLYHKVNIRCVCVVKFELVPQCDKISLTWKFDFSSCILPLSGRSAAGRASCPKLKRAEESFSSLSLSFSVRASFMRPAPCTRPFWRRELASRGYAIVRSENKGLFLSLSIFCIYVFTSRENVNLLKQC